MPGAEGHSRSTRLLSAESDATYSPTLSAMSGPDDAPPMHLTGGTASGQKDEHLLSASGHSFVFGAPAHPANTYRARLGSSGSAYGDVSGSSSLLRVKVRRGSHSRSYTSLSEAVVSALKAFQLCGFGVGTSLSPRKQACSCACLARRSSVLFTLRRTCLTMTAIRLEPCPTLTLPRR
jgi:hypothetical protein